jgi:hypothetical protein
MPSFIYIYHLAFRTHSCTGFHHRHCNPFRNSVDRNYLCCNEKYKAMYRMYCAKFSMYLALIADLTRRLQNRKISEFVWECGVGGQISNRGGVSSTTIRLLSLFFPRPSIIYSRRVYLFFFPTPPPPSPVVVRI